MRTRLLLTLTLLLVAGSAAAQTITIRDRIGLSPTTRNCPITHRTLTTSVLLTSQAVNLRQWNGQSIELTGTMRFVQGCPPYMDVAAVKAVPELTASTAKLPAGYQLNLFGPPGRIYLVGLGLLENVANTIRIPGIDGPLHLQLTPIAILGTYVTRQTAPFATFTAATVPLGVRFYLQAVSIGGPTAEMTIVNSAIF